jgi:ribosome-binding factor A
VTRDVADPRVGFAITSVETTRTCDTPGLGQRIGQPAEREATVAALRRAMPFIRHELGARLRIKRIPDLHVHLDDTAERGTRLLQLLSEIESGIIPEADAPSGESLPTPVARLPHVGDLPVEPPSAAQHPAPRRRRRRPGPRGSGPRLSRRSTR